MLPALLAVCAHTSDRPITVDGVLCHPTQLLVKLADVNDTTALEGTRVLRTYPQIRLAVVEVEPGTLRSTRYDLAARGGIERVEYDRAARPAYTPNDTKWPDMWHARTIKADLAWDLTFGSNAITVAVIDTGVNPHEDLNGNMWTNPGELPGNAVDDDGNGFVDDVNGYDFAYNDPIPNDVNGHGTACAGLVAAVQDNNLGVTGVAPRAKIMGLKAAIDSGYFYDSANIGSYLYAEEMGAKVLSCSFFSDRVSQAERDAIDFVWSRGVLPVVAAGNSASVVPYYPGAYENVIAVAATDQGNARAGFSNFGTWVDVACPGVSLRTTTAGGGYTDGFGGTSGATPQVAGLCALLWGQMTNLTNAQVRAIVEDTATALSPDPSNYGLIDCQKAVRVAMGLDPHTMKSSYVRYLTPVSHGQQVGLGLRNGRPARIHGRGFQLPNQVVIRVGGVAVPILKQTRDFVDFKMPVGNEQVTVYVNGFLRKAINRPNLSASMWSIIEVSSQGGGVTSGGFDQGMNVDSNLITCSRRSDGFIRLEGVFRKVVTFSDKMKLVLTRHYTGSSVGTEKIYLYDWQSASYPYGSFTLVNSGPLPTTATQSTFTINNAWRYVDPEGSVYIRIETSNDVDPAVLLRLDQAQLRDR